jgi:hypothetical protein
MLRESSVKHPIMIQQISLELFKFYQKKVHLTHIDT